MEEQYRAIYYNISHTLSYLYFSIHILTVYCVVGVLKILCKYLVSRPSTTMDSFNIASLHTYIETYIIMYIGTYQLNNNTAAKNNVR